MIYLALRQKSLRIFPDCKRVIPIAYTKIDEFVGRNAWLFQKQKIQGHVKVNQKMASSDVFVNPLAFFHRSSLTWIHDRLHNPSRSSTDHRASDPP